MDLMLGITLSPFLSALLRIVLVVLAAYLARQTVHKSIRALELPGEQWTDV